MFHPSHKVYIKSLYKKILYESSLFFDDRARHFLQHRTRSVFKDYKDCDDLDRIKYKIREGRKRLHRLEKANRGNQKSALKILKEVYGRTGKTRHALLSPYLNHYQPSNAKEIIYHKPFVAHAPRTAPPPELCPPLKILITQHLGKKLEPELPVPEYKPLHVGRKANLLWKHRSMLLDRVDIPLPFEIVCELERKAGAPMTHPLACFTLVTGGPLWDEFYSPLRTVVKMLPHLQPNLKLSPPTQLIRKQKLADSPYITKKPTLLEYIGHQEEHDLDPVEFTCRQKRRLYSKVLQTVPLINSFTSTDLWKTDKQYKISKSHWVPQGVTLMLNDVPTQEAIDATLHSNTKKKTVRRSL